MSDDYYNGNPFVFNVGLLSPKDFDQLCFNIQFPTAGGIVERDPVRRAQAERDLFDTREI